MSSASPLSHNFGGSPEFGKPNKKLKAVRDLSTNAHLYKRNHLFGSWVVSYFLKMGVLIGLYFPGSI